MNKIPINKVNTLSLVLILLMERSVMVNGINTELKMTMDFAKLASKLKKIKNKEFRKTLTLISCSNVKDHVKKKI